MRQTPCKAKAIPVPSHNVQRCCRGIPGAVDAVGHRVCGACRDVAQAQGSCLLGSHALAPGSQLDEPVHSLLEQAVPAHLQTAIMGMTTMKME